MKRISLAACAIAATALGTALLTACGGAGIGLDAVPMPEADLVGAVHPQSMRDAGFWTAVADVAERQSAGVGESTWEQFAFIREVLERTDLTTDDLLEIRIAGRNDQDGFRPLVGFRLAKRLTPEATIAVLDALAEEYDRPVELTEMQHPAGEILQVQTRAGQDLESVWIGFAPGGTVIFQGAEEEVRAAMDRLDAGSPAPLSAELARVSGAADPEVQAWLAYTVSEQQRNDIAAMLDISGAPAPVKGLADSLEGFTAALVEFRAADSMEVRLNWYFDGETRAETFRTHMSGLTELLKGIVALASGGRPIDAVNGMSLTREDNLVRLDLAVSQKDLLTLEELYELNLTE